MALNEAIYLPNPAAAQTKTVGVELTAVGAAATTLATITASTYVRARSFSICITATASVANQVITGILKIGTGKYSVSMLMPTNATVYAQNFSSADLGFDGAWLQGADTITFEAVVNTGAPTAIRISSAVPLEEFTA